MNPFLYVSLANTFSHSLGGHAQFLMANIPAQTVLKIAYLPIGDLTCEGLDYACLPFCRKTLINIQNKLKCPHLLKHCK